MFCDGTGLFRDVIVIFVLFVNKRDRNSSASSRLDTLRQFKHIFANNQE